MTVHVDVWLRGNDFATTESIHVIDREPKEWSDDDVKRLLEEEWAASLLARLELDRQSV
jgi:hypothetical protein